MAKPGETWLVTGASKGIGLQYITQVMSKPPPPPAMAMAGTALAPNNAKLH